MKKTLVFFLFLVTLGSCISCASSIDGNIAEINTKTEHQLVSEHILRSTVTLISPEDGPYCSGFFVSPTRVVTARHCIDPEQILTNEEINELDRLIIESVYKTEKFFLLKYSKKNTQLEDIDITVANLIYISKNKVGKNQMNVEDVAVLEVSDKNKSNDWLTVNKAEPYHGEKLMMVGSPFAIPWVLTFGNVAHLEYNSNGEYLGFLANSVMMSGSSGAPVVNFKGECLGILYSVLDINAQFAKGNEHIPEGNMGLVVGAEALQKHLNAL